MSGRRRLRLTREVELPRELGQPHQIVPAGRDRVLVVGQTSVAVVRGPSNRLAWADVMGRALAATLPDGFLFAGNVYDWTGRKLRRLRGSGVYHDGGSFTELLLSTERGRWTTAVNLSGPRSSPRLIVHRRLLNDQPLWAHELPGSGDAAIAPDGRIAIATDQGRVLMLADPTARGSREPSVVFDVNVSPPAYALGVDRNGIVLLCREHGASKTDVVYLGSNGGERGRLRLPFPGRRLVVGAPAGRTLVVGRGIAALDGRRVAWSQAEESELYATIDGDDLLICRGTQLELRDSDGELVEQAPIAGGPLVCEPALGADGTFWLATASTLWACRA